MSIRWFYKTDKSSLVGHESQREIIFSKTQAQSVHYPGVRGGVRDTGLNQIQCKEISIDEGT